MSYERVTPRARQGTTGICEGNGPLTAGWAYGLGPPARPRGSRNNRGTHSSRQNRTFTMKQAATAPEKQSSAQTAPAGCWDNVYRRRRNIGRKHNGNAGERSNKTR